MKPLSSSSRGLIRGAFVAAAAVVSMGFASRAAASLPEEPGPYTVGEWSNPTNPPIPMLDQPVFYPVDAPCPGTALLLLHGYGEVGAYKAAMAKLLASRGFVVAAPSIVGALANPQPSDGDLLNQFLDWMVTEANDPTTPIAGKIDPSQFGIAGHSNGGVVYYAASTNPKIKAIIGWDAVAALPAAAGIHGPSLHLLEDGSFCGGGSSHAFDVAPEPKAKGVVTGGNHCEFDDPVGPFCVQVCGTPPWEQAKATLIEHYSVAWFTCLLGHDPTMKQYLDFGGSPAGLSSTAMAGSITCQSTCGAPSVVGPDGGAAADGGARGATGGGANGGKPKSGAASSSDSGGCSVRGASQGNARDVPVMVLGFGSLLVLVRRSTARVRRSPRN